MKRFVNLVLTLAILGGTAYAFRGDLQKYSSRLASQYLPCRQPIAYSVGAFDDRFHLKQSVFLKDIAAAEGIWEKAAGRELFNYAPGGDLKINLIYDYRQQATEQLQKLGLALHDDEASYNALKTKYASLKSLYESKKTELQPLIANYEALKREYESEVNKWNSRGGAPKPEYEKLQAQKDELNSQVEVIQAAEKEINSLAESINAVVAVLNRVGTGLNLSVGDYNTVGASRGQEYEEGLYKSDVNGREIDIYEFDSQAKLVRLLSHEMGHALGLPHLDSPQAIMYRLNQGKNEAVTADDLSALKSLCKL